MLQALLFGNVKLLRFWISYTFKLLNGLPSEVTNQLVLAERMKHGERFHIDVNKSLINQYDTDMNELANELKPFHTGRPLPFKTRQIGFFVVRILTIIAAFSAYPMFSFIVSLLQFIVIPYSLCISIGYGLETAFALFTGHVMIFPIIKYFVDLFCPTYLNIYISFSPLFIVIFIIIDQIFCAICLIKTPKGVTKSVPLHRVWESVWYGFLNCKTYYLVLIPLLFGQSFPLTAVIIDALLGISTKVSKKVVGGYWEFLFYHAHRVGHINNVYPDAHKFHHYLVDTTAFDGHIFGSGAPEEWLLIVIEFLIATFLCGGAPPSMSWHVLTVSWYNKWGFHSRNIEPEHHYTNFHADHHAIHNINFGFEYPLEMIMKTTFDIDLIYKGFKLKRVELDNVIRLQFIPCKKS